MDEHPDDSDLLPDEDPTDERLPLIEVESILNRPPSGRRRLVQLGLALLAVVVTLAAFWGVLFPKVPVQSGLRIQPTEAPPTLLITSNVGYGTVTINGVLQRGSLPLNVTMRTPPPYTVILNAPPFRPGYCQIGVPNFTLPPGMGGSCVDGASLIGSGGSAKPMRIVSIFFSLADLPPEQQSQVVGLFSQAAFGKDVPVPAQSYIVTSVTPAGVMGFQRANETLQGTATFVPKPPLDNGAYACQNFICVDAVEGDFSSLPGDVWKMYVPMALNWHFIGSTGTVISDATLPFANLVTFFLAYDQTQGWHIASVNGPSSIDDQLAGLACDTGGTLLLIQVARLLTGEGWDFSTLVDHGAEGCLMELLQNNSNMGRFLWRFGVLMAADTQAHTLFPSLPVAPQDEIAAVNGA